MSGVNVPGMKVHEDCETQSVDGVGPQLLPVPFGNNSHVWLCKRTGDFAITLVGDSASGKSFGVIALGVESPIGVYHGMDAAGLREVSKVLAALADELQAMSSHG